MSTKTESNKVAAPIEDRRQLIDYFAGGEKAKERWRIGTEHEKFVFCTQDFHAPSYDERGGIRDLLDGLTQFGWKPVTEGGNVIALSGPDGTVSLEPAGQLELSGAPLENLHETCNETGRHLEQVKQVARSWGSTSSAWACGPTRRAPSCRSCPRAATGSCCGTCRGWAISGST